MRQQGESKGRGRRKAMLMIYTRYVQTNMLSIWTSNSPFNGISLPHIWAAHVFTCPTAFSSDPSNHSPWIQMCRQSNHFLFSNLCPWPMAIGFFSLFPQRLKWPISLVMWLLKSHLECFRPLILCDHMAVLSIVDQFHLQTVHHIYFCDADCPHSSPSILLSVPWTPSKYSTPRLPIDLHSPGLFLIFHTYFYGNRNPGFNFSLAEHILELLLNVHLCSA